VYSNQEVLGLAIKLGSFYGIPLYLDYTGFIIFALIAYMVGFGMMPISYPGLSWETYLSIGILSAILLFISIIVHELAHSIVAKNNGLKIGRITVYLLGGVSEMEEEPPTANLELKMSAAGPLTSIAIAVICFLGWLLSIYLHASALIQGPLYYSYFVNAIVAAFNLIPAFPMDGGRVLRSLLWRRNGDMIRSTRTASTIGRISAYGMMFVGVFYLIAIDLFTGFWLILIGWFISSAASSEMNQLLVQQDLSQLKASDMMTRSVDSVGPEITLSELSSRFLERKHNGFPVMESNGEIVGCVTMDDLRHVKREAWGTTFVKDAMTPRAKLVTVKESDPATLALTLMTKNKIGRIFVLSDRGDSLAGIITRSDIMKTVQIQETIHGAKGGLNPEVARTIPVEKGMMFEIDSPPGNWTPTYNTSEFTLVSQNIAQVSGGGQSTQFVFEPLQKGRFFITLLPQQAATGERPVEGRGVKYSILVS
jgi:Zn-dependent protease/CBS domain-containing protein